MRRKIPRYPDLFDPDGSPSKARETSTLTIDQWGNVLGELATIQMMSAMYVDACIEREWHQHDRANSSDDPICDANSGDIIEILNNRAGAIQYYLKSSMPPIGHIEIDDEADRS